MGVPIFRKFVMAQDSLKMFVWLTFIFNAQTLNKWMKEEWCRIYDEQVRATPTAAPPPPGLARPHHRPPPAFISGRTHHAATPGARPPAPVCVADAEPRCAPRPRLKASGG